MGQQLQIQKPKKKLIKSFIVAVILITSFTGCTTKNLDKDKSNFEKAIKTLDDSYCETVPSKVNPNADALNVKKILKTEDGRLVVDYSKESCYQYIAESKNDTSICKKIPPRASIINVCIINVAEFNNNIEACKEFVGEDKQDYADTCYHKLAKNLNDPILCDFIVQTGVIFSKQRCLQQFETE